MPSTPAAMIRSTDAEVRALVGALGLDEPRREAAVARLTIIGPRAVGRLIAAFEGSSDRRVQGAILRVLEATGDDRALPAAERALATGGDVAVAAVAVLEALLERASLAVQAAALDALVAVSADPQAERRVRIAATRVVADVSRAIDTVRDESFDPPLSTHEAVWADAADGHLPDDPATLRAAAADQAERAPLAVLHRIIETVRAHETSIRSSGNGEAIARAGRWRTVRGALHQALAMRGSRIAVYDLRETFATGDPLPSSFLAAIQMVGDESCLEPLATAAGLAPDDERWRHQLTTAFHAITTRERLTRRHSAVRRALAKYPDFA